jgi:hypothetical protein
MAKQKVTSPGGKTPAPKPTPKPTPKATPKPTPKPTPSTKQDNAKALEDAAKKKKIQDDSKKKPTPNKTKTIDKKPDIKEDTDSGLKDEIELLRKEIADLTNADDNDKEDPGLAYAKAQAEADRQDAFENLKVVFEAYGLGSLSDSITRIMRSGATANEAIVKLKYDKTIDPATGKAWNAAYTLRFAGNEKRINAGLNALSEAEYINLEDSYANTLKAYGLGNMLTTSRTTNEAMLAKYIGADVSATEFKDRIQTVQDRVVNADPAIKETFKTFYPSITDSDLVQYFLDPATTIGKLKEKATAAEIGAAAKGQGLNALQGTAESLAAYGIDRATALQGYQSIGEVLPASKNLSSIYKEAGIEYNQASGEEEFFKGNVKAAEQRKRLKSLERASFSGESGVGAASLSRATQGSF